MECGVHLLVFMILLSILMEAGHTKFNPDWHFGLWKVKWRHTSVETLQEMADSVTRSSKNGHNIPQLVDDDEKPVRFYDWASFLKKMLTPIPQLKSYHHLQNVNVKVLTFDLIFSVLMPLSAIF